MSSAASSAFRNAEFIHRFLRKHKRSPFAVIAAEDAGLLPREALVDGQVYAGFSALTRRARWSTARGCFVYLQFSHGIVDAVEIPHADAAGARNFFVPVAPLTEALEVEDQ